MFRLKTLLFKIRSLHSLTRSRRGLTSSRTAYGRLKQIRFPLLFFLSPVLILSLCFIVLNFLFPLPVDKLNPPSSQFVLDRNGKLLRAFTAPDEMWRIRGTLQDVSPKLTLAVLTYEDKWFYYHFGLNPISIIKAAIANAKAKRVVSGASTITMQIARMMKPKERTFRNKCIEAFRALQLEWHYSKDEILTTYFNMAPYGGNIVGSAAASYLYFGKPQKNLSLGEAALLATIPNSPARLKPDANPEMARMARNKVLRILLQHGRVREEELKEAQREPLPNKLHPMPFVAPHCCRMLKNIYPRKNSIASTIDYKIQVTSQRILREYLVPLRKEEISNGAVIVMDTKSREVLAMVGAYDFFDETNGGQVNGAIAPRSPGSALKPLIYALALDGGIISPQSILSDVPVDYSGYKPVNYDDKYRGYVSAKEALARSLNVPAVNLCAKFRDDGIYSFLKKAGVSTLPEPRDYYGLQLILGGCEVTLLELTNLYAGLANSGNFAPYRLLQTPTSHKNSGVQKSAKRIFAERQRYSKRLLSEAACFILTEMLAEVRRPDLPACWESSVNLPKVAWKTGTSYGHKDAWSIGYSPQYTIGVWVGNFDATGAPGIVGAEAAAPILFALFNALIAPSENQWFVKPGDVARRQVCSLSGMPMSSYCTSSKEELYIPGISPSKPCEVHREIYVDVETGKRLCSHCRIGRKYEQRIFEIHPPEIATWLQRNGHHVPNIPEHYPNCSKVLAGKGPVIHSPSANCEYKIRQGIEAQYQKILLDASVSSGTKRIFWFLDNQLIFAGKPTEKVFIPPVTGKHHLVCIDDVGRSTETTLTIR